MVPPRLYERVAQVFVTQLGRSADGSDGARSVLRELDRLGIDMEAVTGQLTVDGVTLFARSFDDLLADLTRKQEQLRAVG